MVNRQTMAGRRRQGFTLIELLVVMSIIALLLTIAVPRYFGSLDKAREVTLRENLKVLRETLDKFYADKGAYPATLDELVNQRYLHAVPVDPLSESNASWILVPPPDPSLGGVADVKSGAPGTNKAGQPYASF